jgi:uncharacterized protein YjiK
MFSCETESNSDNSNLLKTERTYSLDIAELSGLFYAGNGILYTVSDNTGKVYKINTTGTILEVLPFSGIDLEAVTIDFTNNVMYVSNEKTWQISKLSLGGELISNYDVELAHTDNNSGIEGLAINSLNGNLLALNEKNPGVILEYNQAMTLIRTIALDFAADYSDIFIGLDSDEMWILSDESQEIFRCDLNANVIEQYVININKPEGIAVDYIHKKIYIVSDSYKKLHQYGMPEKLQK